MGNGTKIYGAVGTYAVPWFFADCWLVFQRFG